MSVYEVAKSGACRNRKKNRRACEDEGGAVLTFVFEMFELSRRPVEMKRDNEKLGNRVDDLERVLEDVQIAERLACINNELSSARKKALEAHVKNADAKCAK